MTTFKEEFEQMDKQDTSVIAPKGLKIKTLEVAGMASVLQALRLPFGLDCRSYASTNYYLGDYLGEAESRRFSSVSFCDIEPKDLNLLSTLIRRGDEDAKAVRGLMVYAEIEAPIWFYRELETYRFGRERLSCESTMHIECKGLCGEELEKAKDEIPMGHYQKTVDVYSYQTLRRIYQQRTGHRLRMWNDFLSWIESLPFANQLILTGLNDGKAN